MTDAARVSRSPDPVRVVGRYRLDAQIGQGGMAQVYRVFDESTGEAIAFKRLERQEPNIAALFEREYHCLASIRHPRIIEVFDFGVDEQGRRFYTMELLAGESLKNLAPLVWASACGHLRDVATSLALLHAQRLLHRDVTPLNIRLDQRGRAKLLDFGALATFGVSAEVVGTPAFMAPEIARGLSADQRVDLFSLGATAYFLLTGKPPYSARSIANLEIAWRSPPPRLSSIVPGIPAALDELVHSMVSVDPLERPASAAEVIDRLGAVAKLDDEPLAAAAIAQLGSSTMVGRDREKELIVRRLEDAEQGLGGAVAIEGDAGLGRSRLGQEAILDARLRGFTSLRVEAVAHTRPLGVVRALIRQLVEALPIESNRALGSHRALLAETFEELREKGARSTVGHAVNQEGAERRARVQGALVEWFVALSNEKPLVVVVDDVHAADMASAGFLLELSHEARKSRLVVIVTLVSDANLPVAVQSLHRVAGQVRLRELDASELERLVESIFGPVPHRARLVEWLARTSRGNPGHSRALLQHLVSKQVIRYAQGGWVLPPELHDEDLPPDLEHALRTRLDALPSDARRLAEVLALYRGTVSLALCERLAAGLDHGSVFSMIDKLIAGDVLVSSGDGYRFGQEVLRAMILASLTDARRAPLHLAIGEALVSLHSDLLRDVSAIKLQKEPVDTLQLVFEAGWHLLRGGQDTRGASFVKHAAIELTVRGEGIGPAIPALEAALQVYRAGGRSKYEQMNILIVLAMGALWVDWRLAYRYGDEALEIGVEALGIARARRWGRWVGATIALWASLAVAAILYRFTERRHIGRDFKEAFAGVLGVGSMLAAVYVILLDVERAEKVWDTLGPLSSFPKRHPGSLVHAYQRFIIDAFTAKFGKARKAGDSLVELLATSMKGMPEGGRFQLLAGLHATLGGINSLRFDGSMFGNIEALEKIQLAGFRHNPSSLMARYHLTRGETALYEQQSERMDVYASMGDSTWREDLILARRLLGMHSFTGDVVWLKRVLERLEVQTYECPSLYCLRDAARASYLVSRGELDVALPIFEELHRTIDEKWGVIYSDNAAAYPDALNRAGRHGRAKEVIREIRANIALEDLEYRFKSFDLDLQDAIADAHLGDLVAANAQIEAALREHAEHSNPLVRGRCHQAAARVALVAGDHRAFDEHLRAMDEWFRRTDYPALVAQHARLSSLGERADQAMPAAKEVAETETDRDQDWGEVHAALAPCRGPAERAQAALDLLIGKAGAFRGYLYLRSPHGLRYVAPLAGPEPSIALRSALSSYVAAIDDELNTAGTTDDLGGDDGALPSANTPGGSMSSVAPDGGERTFCEPLSRVHAQKRAQPVALAFDDGGDRIIVGAVGLIDGGEPLRALSGHFLASVARALHSDPGIQAAYLRRAPSMPPT